MVSCQIWGIASKKMSNPLPSFIDYLLSPDRRRWFATSLLLILVASYTSETFHHYDEQFQVLEFTSFKLGKTPEHDLRWEYPEAMRPWLQPATYYVLANAMSALGIHNPFHWAFAFRLVSGILSWLSLVALCWQASRWLDSTRQLWSVRLQALLFFIPYLSVRTSAETATSSFLWLGTAVLLSGLPQAYWGRLFGSGLLLGTAIALRFPSAVFCAGLFFWLILIQRLTLPKLVVWSVAIFIPLGLSTLVDKWGYGHWTCPMWNYFYQNLVLHKSQEFGTSPFWAYLYLPSANFLFFLTLPLTLAALVAWIRWPRNALSWSSIAYVAVHSLIAHKEARFLFPIAMALPVLVPMAAQPQSSGARTEFYSKWLRGLPSSRWRWFFLGLNLMALVYLSVTPTRKEMILQRKIFQTNPQTASVGLFRTYHPFQFGGMPSYFYRPGYAQLISLDGPRALAKYVTEGCHGKYSNPFRVLTPGGTELPELQHCSIEYESWPEFWLRTNPWSLEKRQVWRSYRCNIDECER